MSQIDSKQLKSADLRAIAGIADTAGLYRKTAAGTAAVVPVGAVGLNSIAAATQLEGRDAIGCGTIATQNSDVVTIARNVAGSSGRLRLFGSAPFGNDQNNGVIFQLSANNPGNRQLQIFSSDDSVTTGSGLRILFNGSTPVLDGVSPDGFTRTDIIFGSTTQGVGFGGSAPALSTVADFFGQPGRDSVATFRSLVTTNPAWITVFTVSKTGIQIRNGATQTHGLMGSKTVSAPSTTDTIFVPNCAVGDIVSVSRGKDAWVSAANTITFDSTGLNGITVTAIVERFV